MTAFARADWFPDWRGKAVAIVASGPSANRADVALVDAVMPVLAIKESMELHPTRSPEVVYGCDRAWWEYVRGLPKFRGLRIGYDKALSAYPDIRLIEVEKLNDNILTAKPGAVGSGGNSGFQALNLAVQFGATRILLLGYDMHSRLNLHWYGRNIWPMCSNPQIANFRRWVAAFERAAPLLRHMGITVINGAPASDIHGFPQMTVERALTEWGFRFPPPSSLASTPARPPPSR